ncbi:hypothetical protein EYF80_057364 [Liparis tanakae]|uniref:Uncharacterized protein n=1 Tax=Liparis tanakae TaxID=230148 RepID=A0A4Z2EUF2_9TELE|nr:hypothetical protein EYF80_057364 [Liparis tanakae]
MDSPGSPCQGVSVADPSWVSAGPRRVQGHRGDRTVPAPSDLVKCHRGNKGQMKKAALPF